MISCNHYLKTWPSTFIRQQDWLMLSLMLFGICDNLWYVKTCHRSHVNTCHVSCDCDQDTHVGWCDNSIQGTYEVKVIRFGPAQVWPVIIPGITTSVDLMIGGGGYCCSSSWTTHLQRSLFRHDRFGGWKIVCPAARTIIIQDKLVSVSKNKT